MTIAYDQLQIALRAEPRTWLLTGVAGFIGSGILERLLLLDQHVTGLDNFVRGHQHNLDEVRATVGELRWSRFRLLSGDIRDPDICREACSGAEVVLHQAALGSVPCSIADPLGYHSTNVTGFLTLLEAVRAAGIRRFVFASSSAIYGDDPEQPKREDRLGRPLSPYAATKLMGETYAGIYGRLHGLQTAALRYFNVFGPRQDPAAAYSAVIPKWIAALLDRQPIYVNGDGETSRDFCYLDNVVQANLLAATATRPEALNRAYNIAFGQRTTLNQLFRTLQGAVRRHHPELPATQPAYRDFREGDIRHSVADISAARELLGYAPTFSLEQGLELAVNWHCHRPACLP